jgi:predicted signal transduction protein with EAL and GGDEF domain
MDARAQARRGLELDLRSALANKEFTLHYQPIIGMGDGQVTCLEALLRWTNPRRGSVSPAEFIPLAEGGCGDIRGRLAALSLSLRMHIRHDSAKTTGIDIVPRGFFVLFRNAAVNPPA